MQGGKINALSLILSTMQRTTFQEPAKTNLFSFLRFGKMVDNNDKYDDDDDDDCE